ncbi:MAG: membrane protein insertase YidC [Frankiaceae bacterium]
MLNPLYNIVGKTIGFFHGAIFSHIFGYNSFFAWALSIVLLTMVVRLILFPLFVKQIKSQRTMQVMQPRIKEIREKYKHDKQKMNEELMALQKEHGNPLLGCLPIFAQIPLFIALFHVLRALQPRHIDPATLAQYHCPGTFKNISGTGYILVETSGLDCKQVNSFANAKLFDVSLSASFRSPASLLQYLDISGTAVKIFAGVLIVLMCTTTFLTQKQIIGRQGPVDAQQRMQQRIILYLIPAGLLFSGTLFPLGVLLYWLTTNLWSMGQQFFVLKRMPPPGVAMTKGRGKGSPATKSDAAAPPSRSTVRRQLGARMSPGKGKPTPAAPEAGPGEEAVDKNAGTSGRKPAGQSDEPAAGGAPGQGGLDGQTDEKRTAEPAGTGDGERKPPVGRQPPPADSAKRPPSPSVASSQARRPAGNRPTKKRGKGQRRGGRH